LDYPSLPSGDYEWQLIAINTFGITSRLLSVKFTITTPFWKTVWFEALVILIFFLLIWLIVGWRIRNIRRQQEEKERLLKEMAELENRALQAQMNPHFIFNCLNSIQQFIFDQDIRATNRYISGFARLIRATLHNSSQPVISLASEVDYLSTYLSLEKMRFKHKMEYLIEIDPDVDRENTLLPPMLIQPYVENSMRHGLRHKTKGEGIIRIMMRRQDQGLKVIVEDNGIGRQKAMEYKTGEHIEYQSKGMSMTADRIRTISALYGSKINIQVEDMMTDDGQPAGTRVVISLPDF
jgi:LytS/YehU family sensor histidine kinase